MGQKMGTVAKSGKKWHKAAKSGKSGSRSKNWQVKHKPSKGASSWQTVRSVEVS